MQMLAHDAGVPDLPDGKTSSPAESSRRHAVAAMLDLFSENAETRERRRRMSRLIVGRVIACK
jgi:hypothetical protein